MTDYFWSIAMKLLAGVAVAVITTALNQFHFSVKIENVIADTQVKVWTIADKVQPECKGTLGSGG